ncbi:hypothetical protein GCM10008090_15200 [Arenicella chitinivorans]|uniref:DUF748 domain-containing protein n=1 Tax=Arenicella chitinivorans TaxID=1329800 RepID=A0A918RR15_9GAMM|nr:DUF748 domain-containing protein [Arenicella chitinivorans]GHA06486.1 hypothetical protein GCM10008090_15200 [Arenicella chitinivorans]
MRISKSVKIALLSLLLVGLVIRGLLPGFVRDHFNSMIAENAKTSGGVKDVDLWLLSGRIELHELSISKADAEIPAPIFTASRIAFSISWRDLFKGRLFGDIAMTQPVLNIVDAPSPNKTQTGTEVDWRAALQSFYPFEINRVYIEGGEVHFRNFNSDPPVDLYLANIDGSAQNITNDLRQNQNKQAHIRATATTIGNGDVEVDASFNLLKQPSVGDLTAKVNKLQLTALNDFTRAYANLDIQRGELEINAHINAEESDGKTKLDGELTPVVTNMNILRWRTDVEQQHDPGIILVWEGSLDLITRILEVGELDRMETSVPIEGTLKEPDVGVWSGLFGLVKHAILGRLENDSLRETD